MESSEKDTMVMKLLHYFITEKNYNPVILHGIENEIWLENFKENYKIIRIVSNYIHNNEQLKYDQFKAKKVGRKIKYKTFSFDMNILTIYVDIGENAVIENSKNVTMIKLTSEDEIGNLEKIESDFPDIRKKLKFTEKGIQLFFKITEDINKKNIIDATHANEVFEPKKPYITMGLIIINFLVFLIANILGEHQTVLNNFCLYGPFVRLGEYYRLFTSMFLHADIVHLILNMYALFALGPQLESYMGRIKYIIIYLFSGLLGNLLSIVFTNAHSVGASGAIFGIMGGLLYFGYHYRVYLGGVLKSQLIPIIVINLVYGLMMTGVDNSAHIGGLIGGVLMTSSLGVKYKSEKSDIINGSIITTIFTAFLIYMALFINR